MNRRLIRALAGLLLIAAAGCNRNEAPGGQSADGGGQKKDYRVAVIRWDPADIYFNGVQLGQEQERRRIESRDGVKIEFRVFGANDVGEQRTALDAQLARGVDGVLLVPWRGEAMRGVLQQLRQQGIPVVVSNAWVPGAEQSFVAFDNEEAGRLAGTAIVNRLDALRGKDWPKQGGVIIELRCIITASFDIGRHNGYRAVFDPIAAANPNVKIETREAGCDGGQARKAVDDLISRYGADKVLAIASIDGTMAVGGAVPALQAQGLLHPPGDPRHVPVTTIDGSQPELEAVKRGDIDHISVQPATGEGIVTMRLLYQMMKNRTVEQPAPGSVDLADKDALWQPVTEATSPTFQGTWYKTRVYAIPTDVKPDDPRNWANEMQAQAQPATPAKSP